MPNSLVLIVIQILWDSNPVFEQPLSYHKNFRIVMPVGFVLHPFPQKDGLDRMEKNLEVDGHGHI